jgi:hypothetical protein
MPEHPSRPLLTPFSPDTAAALPSASAFDTVPLVFPLFVARAQLTAFVNIGKILPR